MPLPALSWEILVVTLVVVSVITGVLMMPTLLRRKQEKRGFETKITGMPPVLREKDNDHG